MRTQLQVHNDGVDRTQRKYPRLKTHLIKPNDKWQIDVACMNDIKGYNSQL